MEMPRTTTSIIGVVVLASGVALGAQSSGAGQAAQAKSDQAFADKAAVAGMAEVELGRMASRQASSSKVKSFGDRMVADHTKAGDELKSIATTKGMTLPTSLDSMHQATRDRLANLSGAEFDRAYMDAMVMGHQTVASELMTEANGGADPQFKAFAAKTLPTVQDHLRMARDIQKEVGGK